MDEHILAAERAYNNLTIANDFMFCHVLLDKNLSLGLVQRIFPQFNIRDIEYPSAQKVIRNDADAKSIRLDVHIVEGNHERVFDMEMQTSDTKNLQKRSRYYLSQIDQDTLQKGCYYEELPAAFVIFICTFDLIGTGRHIYTIKPQCVEEPDYNFNDGTTRIFLNTKGTRNDCSPELKAFLDYVDGKISDDPYVQQMHEAVKIAKQNPEWRRSYMTLYMRDLEHERKGKAEGKQDATVQHLSQLMKNLGLTLEKAMAAIGIPLSELNFYRNLLSDNE